MAKDTFKEIICLKSWGVISQIDDFDIEGNSSSEEIVEPIIIQDINQEFDFIIPELL